MKIFGKEKKIPDWAKPITEVMFNRFWLGVWRGFRKPVIKNHMKTPFFLRAVGLNRRPLARVLARFLISLVGSWYEFWWTGNPNSWEMWRLMWDLMDARIKQAPTENKYLKEVPQGWDWLYEEQGLQVVDISECEAGDLAPRDSEWVEYPMQQVITKPLKLTHYDRYEIAPGTKIIEILKEWLFGDSGLDKRAPYMRLITKDRHWTEEYNDIVPDCEFSNVLVANAVEVSDKYKNLISVFDSVAYTDIDNFKTVILFLI